MNNYCNKLTKKDLMEKLNITDVTADGRVYKNGIELVPVIAKNKNGRSYQNINFSNKTKKIPYSRKYKHKKADGTETIYNINTWTYSIYSIGVHRLVWVWFNDVQPEGYVVDHIDNNSLNNHLDNLQLLTPVENLEKARGGAATGTKSWHKPKKKIYSKEYVDEKLNLYIALYEKAKADGDQKAAHKYRSLISQWRGRKTWLENDVHES